MPSVFHLSIFTLNKSTFDPNQARQLAERLRDQAPGIVSLHTGLQSASQAPPATAEMVQLGRWRYARLWFGNQPKAWSCDFWG